LDNEALFAQGLADRTRGNGFKIAIAGKGVAVIVAGEKMFHGSHPAESR